MPTNTGFEEADAVTSDRMGAALNAVTSPGVLGIRPEQASQHLVRSTPLLAGCSLLLLHRAVNLWCRARLHGDRRESRVERPVVPTPAWEIYRDAERGMAEAAAFCSRAANATVHRENIRS